ncbi:MAG: hypothetical protein HY290_14860 [Planctomycetia bacterium]|nr:hypothetical protein [Planctomycetia bacterium]
MVLVVILAVFVVFVFERQRQLQVLLLDRHRLLGLAIENIGRQDALLGVENDFQMAVVVADRDKRSVVRAFLGVMVMVPMIVVVIMVVIMVATRFGSRILGPA